MAVAPPPSMHGWHARVRIEAARDRILRGQPLADVAAELATSTGPT